MKNIKYTFSGIALSLALIALLFVSCERDIDDLFLATFPTTAEVYIDGFSGGLEYLAFGDSKLDAFDVDNTVRYKGTSSMRFIIPNEGDPAGSYAGGIFVDLGGRDLSGYNALTFWIRGSQSATVGTIGFGTDFDENKFTTSIDGFRISTAWTQYIIPIPDPSLLTQEKGLFLISDGPDGGNGYTIWIDEVQFESLGTIAQPQPKILDGEDVAQQTFIGVSSTITGLSQTWSLPTGIQAITPSANYFTFTSTDTTVAKVSEAGVVSIVGEGTAVITANLGGVQADGSLTVESLGDFTFPPVPTRDAADVISLFSDTYTNSPAEFFNGYYAPFQTTEGQADINIDGDNIIRYFQMNFVGAQFKNPTINASEMTHFHIDLQVENELQPGDFVEIVLEDFGADGIDGTSDDNTGRVRFTSPTLVSGEWVSLDIPFADFAGLTNRSSIWHVLFITEGTNANAVGSITELLVDNMYFYKDDGSGGGGGGDCTAETSESLSAADLDITFMSDPSASITEDGGDFQWVDNPDTDNMVNSSCKVGKITKLGSNPWDNNQIDLDAKLDFNANAGLKVKVWSALPNTEVRIKLEEIGNSSNNTELAVTTTVTSGWEELTFPFANTHSDKFNKIVIFFDLNANNTDTYYFDDLMVYAGNAAACTMETSESLSAADLDMTFMSDPSASIIEDGGDFAWVDNPDADNMVNSSCKVGKITKLGSNPWDNNQIDLDAKLDFNANAGLKVKVWSALANTEVRIKLEEIGNSGNNTELAVTTSVTSGWEELTFPFANTHSDKFDKIVIFFDLNANNTDTYYFDDLMVYAGSAAACTMETSESLSAADLDITFMSDPSASIIEDGGDFAWVDNPDADNMVNSSCKVGKITKLGSNPWDNNQIDLDAKLDFNANAGLKVKVWSALANTEVRIKLEEIGNSGNNTELAVTTSVTSGWEELTFPFSNTHSDKFDKIVIFFDLNANNTDTYYFDDLMVYAGSAAACTMETSESLSAADLDITFMSDPSASIIEDGGDFAWVDNPDADNMVNSSCKVGKITKLGSNPWDNNQIDLDAKLDFNANAGLKVKVWSALANTEVRIKLEEIGNSGNNTELAVTTSVTSGWEELTFPFANTHSDKFNKIVIFFDLNANNTDTYYFDDFALYGTGGGGGSAATFPLDFEDGGLFFNAFEGATVAVIDNPQPTGNSSSKVLELVKPNGVPFFAGINSDPTLNGPVIDLANGLVFTVKVWSPKAGISVRMRLEQEPGITDPPAYEIFQTLANANEWGTLTFDFSTTAALSSYSYTRIVLNTDWGTDPAGGETFYIDDIEQGNAAAVCTAETSQSLAAADFDLTFQTDPGSAIGSFDAQLTTVDNPDFDNGVNSSCKVGKIDRNGGALFANNQIELDAKVDFNANSGFKMKVWSPVAGTPILIKLEDKADGNINTEVGAMTTVASGWEELTFDFGSGESGKYDKIILFFNLNTNTTATYYIDDFALYSSGGGGGTGSELTINGDFETGDLTGWTSFATENNGTFVVTSAQANGGTYSGLIVADVDGLGSPSFPVVKQANIGLGTITANAGVTISFDLFGSVTGAGGVVFPEFFSELTGGGVSKSEILGGGPIFPNGTWTNYTFTTTTGTDVSGGVTLQLKADCGGNAGCKVEAYFDNVSVTIND